MSILITNIKGLVQARREAVRTVRGNSMKDLPTIENAYLLLENGLVHSFGPMAESPERADEVIDASGRYVLPCWCDPHTHTVYAGSREKEFVDKINGLTYEEIAQRGGGIVNSAKRLEKAQEEELIESALGRLAEMEAFGTGAVEIKSGYGLSYDGEIKMLRVIRKLKERSRLTLKATFLGAHAYPPQYKEDHEGYIRLMIEKMLPTIANEGLADYIDVFCDRGFFSADETAQILEAGARYGLRPKIHANELDYSGGIETGVKYGALSVDHLEYTGEEQIQALLQSETMPTLLPSTAFFLGLHEPPARRMIDRGLPVALATDCNPGSSPSGNMQFILSLACIKLKMLPEEAINAATINAAYAMGVEDKMGTIAPGKKASVMITRPMPSLTFMPYSFANNMVERVIIS
ncbi:MAG: imidazolonepropionase [Bacteroidetes bacterium]|nr:imidazolonepropionase [Bacteroidota bacterium]